MNPDKRTSWIGFLSGLAVYVIHGLISGNWSDPTVIANSAALAALGKSAAGEQSN